MSNETKQKRFLYKAMPEIKEANYKKSCMIGWKKQTSIVLQKR